MSSSYRYVLPLRDWHPARVLLLWVVSIVGLHLSFLRLTKNVDSFDGPSVVDHLKARLWAALHYEPVLFILIVVLFLVPPLLLTVQWARRLNGAA